MLRWFRVLMFGLGTLAACNGKLAVLTEPVVEGQGGSGGEDASDTSAGAAGEAMPAEEPEPLLCSQWDPRNPYRLDENIECGSCGCFGAGRSLCRRSDCPAPTTIRRCTEEDDTAPRASVSFSRIVGTTWTFYIKGPGGCGEADFDLCYEDPPITQDSYPHQAWIHALALTTFTPAQWAQRSNHG